MLYIGGPRTERGVNTENLNYQAQAAYLYALKLEPAALAWEYLRRNPTYQSDWHQAQNAKAASDPYSWGLQSWEDPTQDSRVIEPAWQSDASATPCLVRYRAGEAAARFRLWAIRGRKSLRHDGEALRLTAGQVGESHCIQLGTDVENDQPFAIAIAATNDFQAQCQAAKRWMRWYESGGDDSRTELKRPSATALIHMQALQALDGVAVRASHRQIASAIFGASAGASCWRDEQHWRARVRYLIKRGAAQCEGGYRALVGSADAGSSPEATASFARRRTGPEASSASVHCSAPRQRP
jgi:hypothetical protein